MSEDRAISELVSEIEDLLGCGGSSHATTIYDRLKVVSRAITDRTGQRDGQSNNPNHDNVFTHLDDDEFSLPDLALACSRLRLDSGDLVEAVLSGMDAGFTKREAVTMSIIEVLQRRGAYHGRLKEAVDDGTIFQMREDGGDDGPGTRRMGGCCPGSNPPAQTARRIGAGDIA